MRLSITLCLNRISLEVHMLYRVQPESEVRLGNWHEDCFGVSISVIILGVLALNKLICIQFTRIF